MYGEPGSSGTTRRSRATWFRSRGVDQPPPKKRRPPVEWLARNPRFGSWSSSTVRPPRWPRAPLTAVEQPSKHDGHRAAEAQQGGSRPARSGLESAVSPQPARFDQRSRGTARAAEAATAPRGKAQTRHPDRGNSPDQVRLSPRMSTTWLHSTCAHQGPTSSRVWHLQNYPCLSGHQHLLRHISVVLPTRLFCV